MSDADLQHVVAAVTDAFERAQVPWLRQLVELPSHSAAREDVEAAARCLDQAMGDLGFSCETFSDPQGRYADHRVYSSPALSPSTPALALVGHVDTVFPRHMNFTRFERDVNEDGTPGDIIRGPGVLDMKSGLSVIVLASVR